ncbi:MAG: glycosyltransferase family 4 protein [Candidatus Nanohalobium sp.]
MKVVLLSKQFSDGEAISEYVKTISEHLVEKGHEAVIVSFDDGSYYSVHEDVEVVRAPLNFDGDNIYNWSMMMNNELKAQVRQNVGDDVDVIHANDWTTVPGGVSLAKTLERPFILTLHSTENERGFEGEHAELISELEWQGVFESDLLLTTKEDTKNSVLFDLDAPDEKVESINPYELEWPERVLNKYRKLVKPEQKVKT